MLATGSQQKGGQQRREPILIHEQHLNSLPTPQVQAHKKKIIP
jgi:hypothetical protein